MLLRWGVCLLISSCLMGSAMAIDFGDGKSATLTGKAWRALESKNWEALEAYTEKCISLYSKQALKMQAELNDFPAKEIGHNYWALNDVGTCYFIKAKALKIQNKPEPAKKICEMIKDELGFSQCYDSRDFFWSVASASSDLLKEMDANVDYGEYTSEELTGKAWQALSAEDYVACQAYANKCIELYSKEARKQIESLDTYAPKDKAFDYLALNDVGTCYFILGESYAAGGKYKEAVKAYMTLIDEFPYAQCWDPKGWFWKPAVAARGKVNKIRAEQGMF